MLNGYFEIPLNKIEFSKNKLSFSLHGHLIEHVKVRLRKSLNDIKDQFFIDNNKLMIGFSLKDNKVIEVRNLDKLLHKPKVKQSKNVEASKSNKNLRNKKQYETNSKLTHRFRKVYIDIHNLNFMDKVISVKYGESTYTFPVESSKIEYNAFKFHLTNKDRKINLQINNTAIKNIDEIMNHIIVLDKLNQIKPVENKDEFSVNKTRNTLIIPEVNDKKDLDTSKSFLIEKSTTIQLNWDQIFFYEGRLIIELENESHSILDKRSKIYYNPLKAFYQKREIKAPELLKYNGKVQLINIDNFFEYIMLGKLYYDILIDGDLSRLNLFLKSIANQNLTNDQILKLYVNSKSQYLKYLSERHSPNFKIIPIFEITLKNKDTKCYDFSFIFTIEKNNKYYLVWESTETDKATYIFRFHTEESLNEGSKSLQSYIMSKKIKNKRQRLRIKQIDLVQLLNYYSNLNHTIEGFQDWVIKLNNLFKVANN